MTPRTLNSETQINTSPSGVNLVVAHQWEATALLQALKLTRVNDSALPVYTDKKAINLIVTGMGKLNVASGTAYLAGLIETNIANHAWLNVGIAGHQNFVTGTGMITQKIIDANNAKTFFPSLLLNNEKLGNNTTGEIGNSEGLERSAETIKFSDLITVEEVETQYAQAAAYDMEGAAFYESALRFSSLELIQCYKVVSDGPDYSIDDINKAQINQWMSDNVVKIKSLIEKLLQLSTELSASYGSDAVSHVEYQKLTQDFQLSQTQQSQLKRFCQRYYAMGKQELLQAVAAESFSPQDSRQLLNWFSLQLGDEE